ncbi:DUF6226 family protein [Streptomyces avicenniae]|uniref:DUF6226 family protein n=1 Tax=Streptomyces avicenniae TaxID=500153 RepID=UPI0006994E85|nr:DUF6226 family protein [Streptomyces avicenniae]
MAEYVRPALASPVFRDGSGAVIAYGDRWPFEEEPPEDAYSVTAHPERFAPLLTVAEALIAHLTAEFDVVVEEGEEERDGERVRTVTLTPGAADAAPLSFAFTGFPSVTVRGGSYFAAAFPHCGCDACDDSVAGLADELEWQVLAVAAGRLRETMRRGRVTCAVSSPDGDESSTEYRVARVGAGPPLPPDGWRPWPARA